MLLDDALSIYYDPFSLDTAQEALENGKKVVFKLTSNYAFIEIGEDIIAVDRLEVDLEECARTFSVHSDSERINAFYQDNLEPFELYQIFTSLGIKFEKEKLDALIAISRIHKYTHLKVTKSTRGLIFKFTGNSSYHLVIELLEDTSSYNIAFSKAERVLDKKDKEVIRKNTITLHEMKILQKMIVLKEKHDISKDRFIELANML